MTTHYVHPDVWDAALELIQDNATKLFICTDIPTSWTEASATFKLAEVTISDADFTIGDGPACNSRRLNLLTQLAVTPSATGFAKYAVLGDDTAMAERILYVTPISNAVLTSGTAVDFDGFNFTVGVA